MKNTLIIFLFIVSCFACEDAPLEAKKEDSLFKTWQLSESLADIGDGKATWQKSESGNNSTLTFNANGTFKQVNGKDVQTGTFKVLEEKSVSILIIKLDDTQNKEFRWTILDLSETNLHLTFGCIEACGAKYVSVN